MHAFPQYKQDLPLLDPPLQAPERGPYIILLVRKYVPERVPCVVGSSRMLCGMWEDVCGGFNERALGAGEGRQGFPGKGGGKGSAATEGAASKREGGAKGTTSKREKDPKRRADRVGRSVACIGGGAGGGAGKSNHQ